MDAGINVTLKSLFPSTIVTVRVSICQPLPAVRTVTAWSPVGRLIVMGVVLPVETLSTRTSAPPGKDVTLSVPFAAHAVAAPKKTAKHI